MLTLPLWCYKQVLLCLFSLYYVISKQIKLHPFLHCSPWFTSSFPSVRNCSKSSYSIPNSFTSQRMKWPLLWIVYWSTKHIYTTKSAAPYLTVKLVRKFKMQMTKQTFLYKYIHIFISVWQWRISAGLHGLYCCVDMDFMGCVNFTKLSKMPLLSKHPKWASSIWMLWMFKILLLILTFFCGKSLAINLDSIQLSLYWYSVNSQQKSFHDI